MTCSMNFRFSAFVFLIWILLSFFPGVLLAAEVDLESIEVHRTHEWLHKPTIYFQCKGENKTFLPDVRKANVLYAFKGEESWQPLTEFSSKKCKRCGIYEKDILTDDIFDEWEFCPSDFSDGKFTYVKKGEFNATFICSICADVGADPASPRPDDAVKRISTVVVVLISVVATILVVIVVIGGYKYWQKKKRQQEQARFLKLFEEQDDIEDELGLRDII
ncbi:unnamed protein product [Amaranthus hypochondriacus]